MSVESAVEKLQRLPPEMLEFSMLKTTGALAPRLGRLSLPGRKSILTPGFIGNTTRGVIPHVSQDNFRKNVDLGGVYVPLEDCVPPTEDVKKTRLMSPRSSRSIPRRRPPIFNYDVPEPLRNFIVLPQDTLLVLGARRNPPTYSPIANTNTEVGLLTSVGFSSISSEYYAAAARKLQPDIVVGLADIPFGQESVGLKRKDKMSDRTEVWLRDIIAKRSTIGEGEKSWSIFAPILPIERDLQSWYLDHLLDDMLDKISGVAIYDAYLLDDLPDALHPLPRLSLHAPASPQELLRQVSLGMDIFTVPFVSDATDAGIALDFTFPAPAKDDTTSARQSLGIDLWSNDHAVSVVPISQGCTCYACTKHHRAYLQHLLSAKEMLGWVLIQLHNHAILSAFFNGVRASIEAGTFDADVAAFETYYEPALPEKTGQAPRVRGYQFKSEDHAKKGKKNPKSFKKFGEEEVAKLKAAHGQQPNKNPSTRDVIDDEALLGLVGMEESGNKPTPIPQLEKLELEDDTRA